MIREAESCRIVYYRLEGEWTPRRSVRDPTNLFPPPRSRPNGSDRGIWKRVFPDQGNISRRISARVALFFISEFLSIEFERPPTTYPW